MPHTIPAIVAPSASDPLVAGTVERREVGPNDVRIAIAWAGICHSDIHTVRGDWGAKAYPLTVGHEIAGTVVEVGSDVASHRVGDRVGVGCMVNSCGACANCAAGAEQHCLERTIWTYGSEDLDGTITQGGYAAEIVVTEKFVLRVPGSIPFEKAAPLLCAGITTYSPLRHWNAGPGTRVAVVGLGGLGHMAVKIARAFGAEVTVLTRTLAKKDDAIALGAHACAATSDPATFRELRGAFDLMINTVSAPIDLDAHLGLLALDGTMVNVGLPSEALPLHVRSLTNARRSVAGSNIGGIAETQEMLDFCAEHGVAPEVEIVSADQVNEAWQRVIDSDVRYRFVIDAATIV